jgi:hypothetical protein
MNRFACIWRATDDTTAYACASSTSDAVSHLDLILVLESRLSTVQETVSEWGWRKSKALWRIILEVRVIGALGPSTKFPLKDIKRRNSNIVNKNSPPLMESFQRWCNFPFETLKIQLLNYFGDRIDKKASGY